MIEERREFPLIVTFNHREFTRLVIDSHYQKNHPDITDLLILELVELINGSESEPVGESGSFKYFASELVWQEKAYRIILTYCDEDFLGVINAFRVEEKSHDYMAQER